MRPKHIWSNIISRVWRNGRRPTSPQAGSWRTEQPANASPLVPRPLCGGGACTTSSSPAARRPSNAPRAGGARRGGFWMGWGARAKTDIPLQKCYYITKATSQRVRITDCDHWLGGRWRRCEALQARVQTLRGDLAPPRRTHRKTQESPPSGAGRCARGAAWLP